MMLLAFAMSDRPLKDRHETVSMTRESEHFQLRLPSARREEVPALVVGLSWTHACMLPLTCSMKNEPWRCHGRFYDPASPRVPTNFREMSERRGA